MDFSTDIKFDGNLTENQVTTITYSGYLFKNNSSSLKIVYGFGDNWMYTNEQDMEKTENGFVAQIKMLNFSQFNFCFKNENNEWDNNYNSNYIAPISEFKVDEKFILNENEIENIVTHLVEYDISKNDMDQTISFEAHYEENEPIDISETESNVTLEAEINENLNQELMDIYEEVETLDESAEGNSEVIENTQKFDIIDFSELFEDFEEEAPIENFEKISDSTTVDEVVSDLIDDLYNNSKKYDVSAIQENTNILFDKIFAPDEESLVEQASSSNADQELGLIVSPRALSPFYSFRKKVKLAFYKLFSAIPKILSGELNEGNNQ